MEITKCMKNTKSIYVITAVSYLCTMEKQTRSMPFSVFYSSYW